MYYLIDAMGVCDLEFKMVSVVTEYVNTTHIIVDDILKLCRGVDADNPDYLSKHYSVFANEVTAICKNYGHIRVNAFKEMCPELLI